MEYSIIDEGKCCSLIEDGIATTSTFLVPITGERLRDGLRSLLTTPDTTELSIAAITLVRTAESIIVETAAGRFVIPYAHVFPLVME